MKLNYATLLRRTNPRKILRLLKDFLLVFDASYYRRNNHGLISRAFPRAHFVFKGQRLSLNPHANFNSAEYSRTHPKTQLKTQFPFFHYLVQTSSVNPGTMWDIQYLNAFPEVADYPRSLLLHSKLHNQLAEYLLVETNLSDLSKLEKTILLNFPPIGEPSLNQNQHSEIIIDSCAKFTISDSNLISNLNIKVQRKLHSKSNLCQAGNVISASENSLAIYTHEDSLVDLSELASVLSAAHSSEKETELSSFKFRLTQRSNFIKKLSNVDDHNAENMKFTRADLDLTKHSVPPRLEIRSKFSSLNLPNRILLVSHEDSWTGAPIILKEIAEELHSQGKSVEIISLLTNSKKSVFHGMENIKIHHIEDKSNLKPEKRNLINWFLTRNGEVKVRKLISDFAPDFCILNSLSSVDILRIVKSLHLPASLYVHEQWSFDSSNGVNGGKFQNLVKESLSAANSVWFGSEATRSHWESTGLPINSLTIPTIRKNDLRFRGVSKELKTESREKFGIYDSSLIFLSIATFEKRKRIEDIVLAFNELDHPETHLFLVGANDGVHSKYIKKLAGQNPKIRIFSIQQSLEDFYLASDCFVFASSEETMPLVLQEASYFGLPRIISKYLGYSELVKSDRDALLYDVGDVKRLSEQMKKVVNNPALTAEIAENGFVQQTQLYQNNTNSLMRHLVVTSQNSITLVPKYWMKHA